METDDDIVISIVEMLELYQRNGDFIKTMLSKNGDPAFERRLYQLTVNLTRDAMLSASDKAGTDAETRG